MDLRVWRTQKEGRMVHSPFVGSAPAADPTVSRFGCSAPEKVKVSGRFLSRRSLCLARQDLDCAPGASCGGEAAVSDVHSADIQREYGENLVRVSAPRSREERPPEQVSKGSPTTDRYNP